MCSSTPTMVNTILTISVLVVALVLPTSVAHSYNSKYSRWTHKRGPCGNQFICPPNHQCFNEELRLGGSIFDAFYVYRARCAPISAGISGDCVKPNACPSTQPLCQSTLSLCTQLSAAERQVWCQKAYVCFTEQFWYEGKERVV